MKEEAYVNNLKWNVCYESKPPINLLVLVFRNSKKKYMVASAKNFVNDEGEESIEWVTQQSIVHPINDDDLWMNFPYIKTETIHG